ncbi:MAG TPA: hypothetical protein PKB03_07690 [Baekduia sp.]|nr:hypothetical protein [Baekduia sp.]
MTLLTGLVLAPVAAGKLPSTQSVAVPSGGTALLISPDIASGSTTMAIEIKPSNRSAFLAEIGLVAAALPVSGDNQLTCVSAFRPLNTTATFNAVLDGGLLAALALNGCVKLAEDSPGAAGCGLGGARVGMTLPSISGASGMTISGTPVVAKTPRLKVACTKKSSTYVLRFWARKPGRTLRSVQGKNLRLALVSRQSATAAVRVTVTFRK